MCYPFPPSVHGPWQVGHLSATDYTKQAARWAHALRLVDPTIKLVSCGNQGNSEWDREVLMGLIGVCDYHSIHFYSMLGHERFAGPSGLEYEKNVFGPVVSPGGGRSPTMCVYRAELISRFLLSPEFM